MIKMIKKFLKKFRPFRLLAYQFRIQYKKYHIFNFLNKKSIFIDIGANIGEISNYVNDRYLSKIFCYEPNASAYKFLKKRFKNFNNIKVFNYAISNKSSEKYYYFHKNSHNEQDLTYSEAGSLESKKENISIEKKIKVKSLHIKEILDKFKFIDCIKIDIECHEYEILPYIFKNRKKIKKVICELHGNQNNIHFYEKYKKTKKYLKENNLLDNWFIEWD